MNVDDEVAGGSTLAEPLLHQCVSRHQEDVRLWISDHHHLNPAVYIALAQYLNWRPASEMPDIAEWIAVVA
jgi:hypothetical protein